MFETGCGKLLSSFFPFRLVYRDIWRLGHLAVRTFGGQGLKGAKWAVGCGQMAVGTFDGQEICYKGPNGCFAVRGMARNGKMGGWDIGQKAVGTFCS